MSRRSYNKKHDGHIVIPDPILHFPMTDSGALTELVTGRNMTINNQSYVTWDGNRGQYLFQTATNITTAILSGLDLDLIDPVTKKFKKDVSFLFKYRGITNYSNYNYMGGLGSGQNTGEDGIQVAMYTTLLPIVLNVDYNVAVVYYTIDGVVAQEQYLEANFISSNDLTSNIWKTLNNNQFVIGTCPWSGGRGTFYWWDIRIYDQIITPEQQRIIQGIN